MPSLTLEIISEQVESPDIGQIIDITALVTWPHVLNGLVTRPLATPQLSWAYKLFTGVMLSRPDSPPSGSRWHWSRCLEILLYHCWRRSHLRISTAGCPYLLQVLLVWDQVRYLNLNEILDIFYYCCRSGQQRTRRSKSSRIHKQGLYI